MRILLIHSPFCSPASPPYAIARMEQLFNDSGIETKALDLNIFFHEKQFSKYQDYFRKFTENYKASKYEEKSQRFRSESAKIYVENNRKIVDGKKPLLYEELMHEITRYSPEIVAFSIVYSSQTFYSYALIKGLHERGIKTVAGGPNANGILTNSTTILNSGEELLTSLGKNEITAIPSFASFDLDQYFTPEAVIPLKTSSSCPYKGCAFCNHHNNLPYEELSEGTLESTSEHYKKEGYSKFFLLDDMISPARLITISKLFKGSMICQLKPTKDFDYITLSRLKANGIKAIMWGIESGSDRILKRMGKNTNIKDIKAVLEASHKAGIINIAYIMFGFPGETEDEFNSTIQFLEENTESIDLVSHTTFGLQKGTRIYNNQKQFGISEITETERTILDPKIFYKVSEGLSHQDTLMLLKKNQGRIRRINKIPKGMNFFREHMLFL